MIKSLYNHRMPNYRRVKIKGGTYFFTLVTLNRATIFRTPESRALLLEAIEHINLHHPFFTEAFCVLPDHIHLLWRLPEDDDNYSIRIAEIKKRFSKNYLDNYPRLSSKNTVSTKREESGIWQRRFWEHYIRDEADLNAHINYIHYNPVKHGLVAQVKDWPCSSFFDHVKAGHYPMDWGEGYQINPKKTNFGE